MLANVKIELQMQFFRNDNCVAGLKNKLKTSGKANVFSMGDWDCPIIFHHAVSIGDVPFNLCKETFKTGLS
jgi:hypothetical protein